MPPGQRTWLVDPGHVLAHDLKYVSEFLRKQHEVVSKGMTGIVNQHIIEPLLSRERGVAYTHVKIPKEL
jgi:hypothetical protein